MKKRFLSALLAFCMVLTLLPSTAFAADSDFTIENGVLTKYNGSGGDVTIPDSVTSIGDNAFVGCTSLTSVSIPSGVTSIGATAFCNCSNLASVNIPSSVTSIGYLAFACTSLTSVTIPSGVTSIEENTFEGCTNLASVTIPNSVTSIGDNAFAGCIGLSSITIPNSVTRIGSSAFDGCSSLTSMTIPDKVTYIGVDAFGGCSGLTSTRIPSGVTSIRDYTFVRCSRLTSVIIPSSITHIGFAAFGKCSELTDIYYGGDESNWSAIDIEWGGNDGEGDNDQLKRATIHYNSTGPGGMGSAGENPTPSDPSKIYAVYCNGGYERFDVSLEECMAKTVSTTYNPQLAHMLMAMCYSVKSETDITKTFESFDFSTENIHTDYSLNEFWEAYGIAKKQIGNQTLVLVVLRGTEDGWEIADDILGYVNPDNYQQSGFAFVANKLYDKVTGSDFLGTTNLSNTTFVITGFSRGAAVANLLAARLLKGGTEQSNVFTYTFACPDSASIVYEYQCIFNISNVNDKVSWSPSGWFTGFDNWSKYGRSYWFSNNWDDYKNLEMSLDFENIHNEEKYLEYLRQEKPTTEYRARWAAKAALDDASQRRFWDSIQGVGKTFTNMVGFHCPVDVKIYASGQLVGSIIDNLVEVNDESKVYISVINDEKNVHLLTDDIYTFSLTATGDGRMSYIVQNIDVATRDVVDEQVFEQVALVPEKQFISEVKVEESIATDVETQEVKLYVLGDDGQPTLKVLPDDKGTEVPLDAPDAIYTISFDTTVTSIEVSPMKTQADGKLSSLPKPTRGGYNFNGWFTAASGGSQITTETIFDRNTTVYAHWTYAGGGTSNDPSSSPSSGGGYSSPTYSITVPNLTGGTITINPNSAQKDTTVTITATPDAGYKLVSVTVSDSGGKAITLTDKGNGKYTFTMPSGKVTVGATFQPDQIPWNNPFIDVVEGEWYYEAVRFVQENGLMSGYGNGTFAPNANLSRAMLPQILYNKEGHPAVTGNAFIDVVEGTWYADAVTWAAGRGIVSGYGNRLFGPNDNITREQLAVMLWRYAGEPAATDRALHFSDADTASGFAIDALCWATENNIINGKGGGILDPKGQATRAEVAQMLMNYLKR